MTVNDEIWWIFTMALDKARQWKLALKKSRLKQLNSRDTYDNHIQSSCPVLNPHATLPLPLWSAPLATAASCTSTPVACGGQVLIDGATVGNETHAQLEVPGQSAVCGECQDQQRGEQQKAHHQQSHAAGVIQQVWAVQGCSMGLHLESKRRRRGVNEDTWRHKEFWGYFIDLN